MNNEITPKGNQKNKIDYYLMAKNMINELSIKRLALNKEIRSLIKGTPLEVINLNSNLTDEIAIGIFNDYIAKIGVIELQSRLKRIDDSVDALASTVINQKVSRPRLNILIACTYLRSLLLIFMELTAYFLEGTRATQKLKMELDI